VTKLHHAIVSGGDFKFYSLPELSRGLSKQEKSYPSIDSDKQETTAPRNDKEIPVVVSHLLSVPANAELRQRSRNDVQCKVEYRR
jgi:hypothetical protein